MALYIGDCRSQAGPVMGQSSVRWYEGTKETNTLIFISALLNWSTFLFQYFLSTEAREGSTECLFTLSRIDQAKRTGLIRAIEWHLAAEDVPQPSKQTLHEFGCAKLIEAVLAPFDFDFVRMQEDVTSVDVHIL